MADQDDAGFYLAAIAEYDRGDINEGAWAKAITLEQGDEKRAKYTYVRLRVKQFEQAKKHADNAKYTKKYGVTDAPDMEKIKIETQQFNWGAALLPFLWSLFNTRGWHWGFAAIAGTLLIPGIGWLVTGIVFGIFGSRWSWASKNWVSLEAFKRSQRGWTIGGVTVTVTLLMIVLMAGGG